MNLENKTVFVAGLGLIGSAIAEYLNHSGAEVIAADLDTEKLERFTNRERFKVAKIDITDSATISLALQDIRHLDAAVNCAYPRVEAFGKGFEELSYKEFCGTTDLHMGGAFIFMQSFGAYFVKQGFGNIINMSSIYGVIAPRFEIYGNTGMSNPIEYGAIKAGIIHMTRYCAKYYKGKNIRVNCISPGGILDGQSQDFLNEYNALALSKGMLDATDLCGTVSFLISDESKMINGQNLVVDDGWTL